VEFKDCIEAKGKPDAYGYGLVNDPRTTKAHRLAWIKTYGDISSGLHVLHKCDNRKCIKPEHLFLGTNADNVRDRVAKGRSHRPKGELNPKVKLTVEKVKFIKQYPKTYGYRKRLAEMFNISVDVVSDIKSGRTWQEVSS